MENQLEWPAIIRWATLALIIAGIAHSYERSRTIWLTLGLIGGPITLLILICLGKAYNEEDEDKHW